MKAVLFSDSHIHFHKGKVERLVDCLDVLKWVFQVAEDQKAEYIFFLGDLLQERSKIDLLSYVRTCEVFMEEMMTRGKTVKVFLLVGNHDMYHKTHWKINSIKPLTAIPNIFIVDKPTSFPVGRTRVDWLPHTDTPLEELGKFQKNPDGPAILLGHIAVKGAMLNAFYGIKSDLIVEHDSEMLMVDTTVFQMWDSVFLGHYHGAQKLSPTVEYLGSPLQLSFGEAFQDKHVVVLDLETLEKEYVVNTFSPKHYIITPDDVHNESYDLNGHFVRVVIEPTISKVDHSDLRRKIEETWNVATLDFKMKDRIAGDDKTMIEEAKQILEDEENMFESYTKAVGIPENLERDKLHKIGMELCSNLKT